MPLISFLLDIGNLGSVICHTIHTCLSRGILDVVFEHTVFDIEICSFWPAV